MRAMPAVIIILFAFFYNSSISQNIIGQDKVAPYTITSYSINVSEFDHVEWRLVPANYGTLVSNTQKNKLNVQWNEPAFSHDSAVCNLMALVHIPNSETTLNYIQKILILKSDNTSLALKSQNNLFSKQSIDSLRFYYQILCDGSVSGRKTLFNDSSLQIQKSGFVRKWKITTTSSKELVNTTSNPVNIELRAGKYLVTLLHTFLNKVDSISDTLTVYDAPVPSFSISSSTPCQGSLVTFTNTSSKTELSRYGTFYFGNGNSFNIQPSQTLAYYSYLDKAQSMILLPHFELNDLHGCSFKSKEQPIMIQQNKFSVTNVSIYPKISELKNENDKISISCQMGANASPANPNAPYTYLWNTGQTTPQITATEPGEYTVHVIDKYGCKSIPLISKVMISYKEKNKPKISGQSTIKAGSKMTFKMEQKKDCLYQWKFIYNNAQPITTPVNRESSIVPQGWEKSKPGTLFVLGIELKNENGRLRSVYSDTLKVTIQ